jgi:hypothetical protein
VGVESLAEDRNVEGICVVTGVTANVFTKMFPSGRQVIRITRGPHDMHDIRSLFDNLTTMVVRLSKRERMSCMS